MKMIFQGLLEAIQLIVSFDPVLVETVLRSLLVSSTATVAACFVSIPLFTYLGMRRFKGEKLLSRVLNTLMSTPSVIVGLMVMLMISRRGPFGSLRLIYTVKAMIIAQFFLLFPLISAMTYELSKAHSQKIRMLARTLGANKMQAVLLVMAELKQILFAYMITTFSRAISEVGAVMMVGGNVDGYTRVITTSISLYNSMGEYATAIALGVILLTISFGINWFAYYLKDWGYHAGKH